MSFETEIQKAVFARLSGISGMPDVYDHVPQQSDSGSDVPFPYISIGEDAHIPFDTDDASGDEATLTVHSWSRARGRAEIKEIQGSIYEALHRFDLEVEGFHMVTIDFEFSDSLIDPDTITRHGVQQFRILLHE